MKVLIVTMHFPPAAGGGVIRPLKFAEHLPSLGVETHVLTPEDPKWVQRDESLALPSQAIVHRVPNLGPATRLRGRELYGRRRAARAVVEARLLFRRALVPDSEVVWSLTATAAAIRIVRRHAIDVVLTTSPPDSLHLLGLAVKRATRARWVADLRDSMTASPFRRREVRGERRLAVLVARRADAIVAVTDTIAEQMRALGAAQRVEVIENGCDAEDFAGLTYENGDVFRITHTGSFFDTRDPRAFLRAVAAADDCVVARFVGDFREADRDYAESLGLGARLEVLPFQPRRRTLALQRGSEALLLLIGDTGGRGGGVLTGKVFEYLLAGRPIVAAVPPDGEAARLIRTLKAGTVVAPDDADGLASAIADLSEQWSAGTLDAPTLPDDVRRRLSRRAGAERLGALLHGLSGARR